MNLRKNPNSYKFLVLNSSKKMEQPKLFLRFNQKLASLGSILCTFSAQNNQLTSPDLSFGLSHKQPKPKLL